MFRSMLGSLVVLGACAGFVLADNDKTDNKGTQAKVVKVDAKANTVTVKMQSDGKEVEKTLQLAEGAEFLDNKGKAMKLDTLQPGDHVLITEKAGKVTALRKDKERAEAKITNVDLKKGTVTVMMKNKEGKEVEKTFQLMEDAEYFDSTGKVAKVDIFRSGDQVLIVEVEGKIKELKKDNKENAPTEKKPSSK